MFQANALIDLARLLAKKYRVGSTDEHSTTKQQRSLCANIEMLVSRCGPSRT